MHIMTAQGWKPLINFDAHWAAKHAAIDTARAAWKAACSRQCKPMFSGVTDEEARANAHEEQRTFNTLSAAYDAFRS